MSANLDKTDKDLEKLILDATLYPVQCIGGLPNKNPKNIVQNIKTYDNWQSYVESRKEIFYNYINSINEELELDYIAYKALGNMFPIYVKYFTNDENKNELAIINNLENICKSVLDQHGIKYIE